MVFPVSILARCCFGMRIIMILVLALYGGLAVANTSAVPGDEYFLKEPVFGGRARIVEAGSARAPLVVLVHGLNESAEDWFPFIPALSEHLHVLSFDLPGFGKSSKANKNYSPDNYVRFIHYLVGHYAAQRIILVGHSLGANIALRYAARYPQQVERLMLIDAAGILHRFAFSRYLSHFGIRVLPSLYPDQRRDLQSFADGLLGTLTQYSALADLGESAILNDPALREDLMGGYPPAIATHAMMMTEFRNILDNFRVPTLLLWGGNDRVTPLRTAKMLAANFENAGLVIIKQAGHNPLHDTPRQIREWLQRYANADSAEANSILQLHRYAPPPAGETGRIGSCRYENNKTFHGRYNRVTVDHCKGVLFQDFVADSVTVTDSEVVFENCRLNSTGKSLWVKNSQLVLTACRIQGSPAIYLENAKLDMAGCHVFSTGLAIKTATASAASHILFSISRVNAGGQSRLMHGPIHLDPGENL